jgi:hypothetical protein
MHFCKVQKSGSHLEANEEVEKSDRGSAANSLACYKQFTIK